MHRLKAPEKVYDRQGRKGRDSCSPERFPEDHSNKARHTAKKYNRDSGNTAKPGK